MSKQTYNAFEQMANLNRQISRENRQDSSPPRPSQTTNAPTAEPTFITIHNTVETFKTYMPPFIKKIMENVSIKYAKISCSIRNLKAKLKYFNEILPGQELPAELKYQQKYYDTLVTAAIKETFVKNLLSNKKAALTARITENEAIYNSRKDEIQSLIATFSFDNCGSELLNNCKVSWEVVLECYIHLQIGNMTAKSQQDQLKKDQKRKQFEAKKEEMSKVKIVTVKEYEKLAAEIKSLKISAKKSEKNKFKPKNTKGEKTVGKGPSPNKKKTQPKRKAKTQSKGNGNTKGTSTKKK
jgi:hypothetical protein